MKRGLWLVVVPGILCLGCGGIFGGSGGGRRGLVVLGSTPSNAVLRRINTDGTGMKDVAGSTQAFEASMDENNNVFTSLPDGNISRITNGSVFALTNSGQDRRPCVTPDGSRIAFVSARDGNDEIYTMTGAGGSQTNVSSNAGADTFPAISMDGAKVVFTSSRDGNDEIYIVNFNGTGSTRLTNDPGDDNTPAFTPDGTHIVFASNRSGVSQLYLMDTSGGNVTQLTTSSTDKYHPSFNVEGSKIFYYTATGTRQIWRCNADGTGEVQITHDSRDVDKMSTWVY